MTSNLIRVYREHTITAKWASIRWYGLIKAVHNHAGLADLELLPVRPCQKVPTISIWGSCLGRLILQTQNFLSRPCLSPITPPHEQRHRVRQSWGDMCNWLWSNKWQANQAPLLLLLISCWRFWRVFNVCCIFSSDYWGLCRNDTASLFFLQLLLVREVPNRSRWRHQIYDLSPFSIMERRIHHTGNLFLSNNPCISSVGTNILPPWYFFVLVDHILNVLFSLI